jgi:hypothetical protein
VCVCVCVCVRVCVCAYVLVVRAHTGPAAMATASLSLTAHLTPPRAPTCCLLQVTGKSASERLDMRAATKSDKFAK